MSAGYCHHRTTRAAEGIGASVPLPGELPPSHFEAGTAAPLHRYCFGQCMTFGTAAGGMRYRGAQKPPLTICPGGHCTLLTAGMGAAAAGISAISSVAKVATGFIISASSRTHCCPSGFG